MTDLMQMLTLMIGEPTNDIETVILYVIGGIVVVIVVKGVAYLFYTVSKAFK